MYNRLNRKEEDPIKLGLMDAVKDLEKENQKLQHRDTKLKQLNQYQLEGYVTHTLKPRELV